MKSTRLNVCQRLLVIGFTLVALLTTEARAQKLELLGQLGGKLSCQALDGNVLLAGVGSYIKVFDISNPAQPVELSTINLPYASVSIAVQNHIAYIGMSQAYYGIYAGFVIYDISDPSRPVKRGSVSAFGSIYEIVVSGSGLYFALAGDFGTATYGYDVSDPDHPALMTGYGLGKPAPEADRLYVYSGYQPLRIRTFDPVTTNSAIATADLPTTTTHDLAVSGGIGYFARGANGLDIYDLKDPANPQFLGGYKGGIHAEKIKVSGKTVYILDSTTGVLVFDVTNAASPSLLRTIPMIGARTISVSGGKATVNLPGGAINILDISVPADAHVIGSYQPKALNVGMNFSALAVADGKAYVTSFEGGIKIADVNDPTSLGLVSSHLEGASCGLIRLRGSSVLAASRAFLMYDINRLEFQQQIGSCGLEYDAQAFDVLGNFCYFAEGMGGFQVVDISDPAHPLKRGLIASTTEYPLGVRVSGNFAYVSEMLPNNNLGVLRVVDISNPDTPVHRGSHVIPSRGTDIDVKDGVAYVIHRDGLATFDLRDPDHPAPLGSLAIMNPRRVVVDGNNAFICANPGVLVVDISRPQAPNIVCTYEAQDGPCDLVVDGQILYVLDNNRGLFTLRFEAPNAINYAAFASYE